MIKKVLLHSRVASVARLVLHLCLVLHFRKAADPCVPLELGLKMASTPQLPAPLVKQEHTVTSKGKRAKIVARLVRLATIQRLALARASSVLRAPRPQPARPLARFFVPEA